MSRTSYHIICLFPLVACTLAALSKPQREITPYNTWISYPPDIDLLTILNETSSNPASESLASTYLHLDPRINRISCLADKPRSNKRQRIIPEDYKDALYSILTMPDAMQNQYFDFVRGKVKQGWRSESCDISMSAMKTCTPEAFPIILVAHVAALIVKQCMTQEKGYLGGGGTMFGDCTVTFIVRNPDLLGTVGSIPISFSN